MFNSKQISKKKKKSNKQTKKENQDVISAEKGQIGSQEATGSVGWAEPLKNQRKRKQDVKVFKQLDANRGLETELLGSRRAEPKQGFGISGIFKVCKWRMQWRG